MEIRRDAPLKGPALPDAPTPTPTPAGPLLLRRGLVAIAVGVPGCAQKTAEPAAIVQPEVNTNAPEATPTRAPEPPPRPRTETEAPPPSPFLVAPGGGAAITSPDPTPTPIEAPRLGPTSTRANPVITNTIVAPPPHPPPHPHPWNNAPHPWQGNRDTAPHPVPPHPAPGLDI